MGQPVTVIEKSSRNPGMVRFEINRAISGMGHEYFTQAPDPLAQRPVDKLASKIFGLDPTTVSVHINANVITIKTNGSTISASSRASIRDVIANMFIFYTEGS